MQSFRSRNAIYRRATPSTLYDPQDFSSYEGVLEPEGPGAWFDPEIGGDPRWQKRWDDTERVEMHLTPTRIVLLRRGGAQAARMLPRTPYERTSENSPSTHSGEQGPERPSVASSPASPRRSPDK